MIVTAIENSMLEDRRHGCPHYQLSRRMTSVSGAMRLADAIEMRLRSSNRVAGLGVLSIVESAISALRDILVGVSPSSESQCSPRTASLPRPERFNGIRSCSIAAISSRPERLVSTSNTLFVQIFPAMGRLMYALLVHGLKPYRATARGQ